jgi:uncharacterized membrane protein YczE
VAFVTKIGNLPLRYRLPRRLGLARHLRLSIGLLVLGVALTGLASGLYIGAALGPGPRDGLMTGLAARTGRSLRLVRTVLEVAVVLAGWVLGGTLGVGTLLYAFMIGRWYSCSCRP